MKAAFKISVNHIWGDTVISFHFPFSYIFRKNMINERSKECKRCKGIHIQIPRDSMKKAPEKVQRKRNNFFLGLILYYGDSFEQQLNTAPRKHYKSMLYQNLFCCQLIILTIVASTGPMYPQSLSCPG